MPCLGCPYRSVLALHDVTHSRSWFSVGKLYVCVCARARSRSATKYRRNPGRLPHGVPASGVTCIVNALFSLCLPPTCDVLISETFFVCRNASTYNWHNDVILVRYVFQCRTRVHFLHFPCHPTTPRDSFALRARVHERRKLLLPFPAGF